MTYKLFKLNNVAVMALNSTVRYCAVVFDIELSRTVLLWGVLPPGQTRGLILNLRITLQGYATVEHR